MKLELSCMLTLIGFHYICNTEKRVLSPPKKEKVSDSPIRVHITSLNYKTGLNVNWRHSLSFV